MVQWGMPLDPEAARKALRLYRRARFAHGLVRDHRKVRSVLEQSSAQNDAMMDAETFVDHVRKKKVHPEDIRMGVRAVVNSAPRVYRFVSRHIQKSRGQDDA